MAEIASHPDSYTVGANGGRQNKLSSAEISLSKYSVYARLPSYPQPTNIDLMFEILNGG